ncbi:PREDICTED: vegetative cell wall protein gp1-like [Elephantulus edwardii]|uniref:vegetative cell wall protein gp1-like n=1 Tax=Elephantulus edwardii TaxID=28737 RepID=UPI0003F0A6DB|nr:PREDICTED: vegetative cell wall protein gp1-like [Elephantulus edwardii]
MAGALPAPPTQRGAHKAGGRLEFGVRSHCAGLPEAEPSGERRLDNDGCPEPAAPSPGPPTGCAPPPAAIPCHGDSPAPRPPCAPPAPRELSPRCEANKQRGPAALLPLPTDRLASSHLGRSRSEPRLCAGGKRTQGTSGATWRPPQELTLGGRGAGWLRCSGGESLYYADDDDDASPASSARWGPLRVAPLGPLPFFSSARTWSHQEPWDSLLGLSTPAPPWPQLELGRSWDRMFVSPPSHAATRAPSPLRPTSPGRPPAASAAAPGGRHFVRAGAQRPPANAAWSVREGARVTAPEPPPPLPLSQPAPARPSPARLELELNFSFLFLSQGTGNSCSAPAGGHALALLRAQTRSLRSPCPPTPAAQQKAIYMRGSDPRPDRAPPPPASSSESWGAGQRSGAGSGLAGGAALLPPLSPQPSAHAQLLAPNSALAQPRLRAVSCRRRRPSWAHGELSRSPGRSGSSTASAEEKTKRRARSGVGSAVGG